MSPIPPFTPGQDVSQADLDAAIADLIAGAPGALDTLNELAASINDDAAVYTTLSTALSDHVGDTSGAHASSAIGYDNTVSGLTATDVKGAIDEVAAAPSGGTHDAVLAFLNSHIIGVPAGTGETINAAAYAAQWTADADGAVNVGWDAVNARPYAVNAGRFRVTWNLVREMSGIAVPAYVKHECRIRRNVLGSFLSFQNQGSDFSIAGSKQDFASGSEIIELAANDYVTIQAVTFSATTLYLGISTGDYTSLQLEYLGPTP